MSTFSKLGFVAFALTLASGLGCTKKEDEKVQEPSVAETTDAFESDYSDTGTAESASSTTEVKEEAPLSPAEELRAKLRSSFLELNCLRKSSGPEKSLAVYKAAGFDDAASWSKAWHEEAEKNVEWASKIIEEAVEKGCKVKLEAPLD